MTTPTSSIVWKKIKNGQLSNLHVLTMDGTELGFIYKPNDFRTDKNAWRLHTGIGERTNFLGHEWNKGVAMKQVEKTCGVVGLKA
jgi:hypothetical protein